jgi:hypothetical protein
MTEHKAAWELLPDIAAGTYESDELVKVEAHLADCPICRVELDSLRDAVQLLTGAPELLEPPAGLRERVLAAAHESNAAAPAPAPQPVERRRRWSERRWWPVALASCTALAAIIVGIVVSGNTSNGSPLALTPPPHAAAASAWGKASWGRASNGNVPITIKVGALPKPSGGFYEVWFGKGKDQRQSVGTFTVDSSGSANVTFDVPEGVSADYKWIWVTRENDDGNPQPSSDTVLFADL